MERPGRMDARVEPGHDEQKEVRAADMVGKRRE